MPISPVSTDNYSITRNSLLEKTQPALHHLLTARSPSATGEVTRENLPFHMQQVASNYYGQPFPHYDQIQVDYKGKEILWKTLTPQQKFDVVYEHSLPHNRPKLLKREAFHSDEAWTYHIEYRLLRGSHTADGNPYIPEKLKRDPRQSHGIDHAMRVAIFSAVYANLYNKYDPDAHLTPDDILAIQLTGAYHDSGRQTEGVDIDDRRSARNAAKDLKKWGFSDEYVRECFKAIADKDDPKLSTKHRIAKCVQCADSTEYGRFGSFNPEFLDIYKEFNGEGAKPLKNGRTLAEFNQELHAINQEMIHLIKASSAKRVEFSQPGKNAYSEILKLINPVNHPKMNAIFNSGSFPTKLSDLRFISMLGGSMGSEKVEDQAGTIYAKKRGNPLHLNAEYYTNKAYQVLGVKVPEVAFYTEGQPVMLSKFVPKTAADVIEFIREPPKIRAIQDAAKKSFVADCLLANWDVVGLCFDNMKYDPTTNEIWRIDNGSGLDFRAQGAKKDPHLFTAKIQEFETMRNPKINPSAALLYATITDEEVVKQIDDILPKRAEFLAAIPSRLQGIMGQRFDYLRIHKQKLISLETVQRTHGS